MAFSTTGLGAWVNENNTDLLAKAILEAKSFQVISNMGGVKYKEAVKFLDVDSLIQAYACGTPTTSGTTTISDKDIEVVDLMVYEELCPEDLNTKATQLGMKPGMNEDFYFEQQYAEQKIATTQKQLESYCWGLLSGTTSRPASILSIAGADANVVDRSFVWSGSTFTADEYSAEVFGMLNSIPEAIQDRDDLTLFVPHVISRKMLQAFVTDGNYHIDFTNQDGNSPWTFPGTNVTVFPTQVAANNVVLTPAFNIIYAYDLVSEYDTFKLWWSDDDQNSKFLMKFRAGFNYYFGEYIVWSR